MNVIKTLMLLSMAFVMTGCATRLEATVSPGQSLDNLNQSKIYVVPFAPDKRNLHYIIADKLTLLGHPATPLDSNEVPKDADIRITYVDNWQWDMTNYLIKIKIDFRNAESKQLLVTGESFRTSLVRKDPDYMIQEALEKILQESGIPYHHLPKE